MTILHLVHELVGGQQTSSKFLRKRLLELCQFPDDPAVVVFKPFVRDAFRQVRSKRRKEFGRAEVIFVAQNGLETVKANRDSYYRVQNVSVEKFGARKNEIL